MKLTHHANYKQKLRNTLAVVMKIVGNEYLADVTNFILNTFNGLHVHMRSQLHRALRISH